MSGVVRRAVRDMDLGVSRQPDRYTNPRQHLHKLFAHLKPYLYTRLELIFITPTGCAFFCHGNGSRWWSSGCVWQHETGSQFLCALYTQLLYLGMKNQRSHHQETDQFLLGHARILTDSGTDSRPPLQVNPINALVGFAVLKFYRCRPSQLPRADAADKGVGGSRKLQTGSQNLCFLRNAILLVRTKWPVWSNPRTATRFCSGGRYCIFLTTVKPA